MAIELDPSRYLIISDLQIPFHHQHALEFCKYIVKHYRIPKENILNVGDELDQLHGGLWPKDPNGIHSALTEHNESLVELKRWYDAFPEMRLCLSNHGSRWIRKATKAEIPSMMLRRYEEVIQAPAGWQWAKRWVVPCKHRFGIEHGDDVSGHNPGLTAALLNGYSTAVGHWHSKAGVDHVKTNGMTLWGMTTGSLIDADQYAFDYSKNAKHKPVIGLGVVVDDGRNAIWLPL
jgi:hypothetical protein